MELASMCEKSGGIQAKKPFDLLAEGLQWKR
jgi:hypothetical protein